MKIKFILFVLSLSVLASCASTHERTPSSVQQDKEQAHEKFQGAFDKQY